MNIAELEKMNEDELEELDTKAKAEERTMLDNLNIIDEKIGSLDKEIVLKELELKGLRQSLRMGNRNMRKQQSEMDTIIKYLWKVRKGR